MSKVKNQYKHSYKNRYKLASEKTVRGKTYRERYAAVIMMLMTFKDWNAGLVLDFGCGDGFFISTYGAFFDKIVGLDLSFESLRHIEKLGDSQFIQGDIENLPLEDQSVQWGITIETLEHLEDMDRGLREIGRCLRLSGIMIVTVPSLLSPRNINVYGRGSYLRGLVKVISAIPKGYMKYEWQDGSGYKYPHWDYTKWKFRDVVKKAGLRVLMARKMPVILNSKEDSLIERIINRVTGNRLGECHIMAVGK